MLATPIMPKGRLIDVVVNGRPVGLKWEGLLLPGRAPLGAPCV